MPFKSTFHRKGCLAGCLGAALLGTAGIFSYGNTSSALAREAGIELGVLNCRVAGGAGFVFGSTKHLDCVFDRVGKDERYIGTISKFGIDIGATAYGSLSWGVLAPTSRVGRGALAGNYGGVSGEATLGLGIGANALIGGSSESIVLQPISLQTQEGVNVAAGVAALELRPAR